MAAGIVEDYWVDDGAPCCAVFSKISSLKTEYMLSKQKNVTTTDFRQPKGNAFYSTTGYTTTGNEPICRLK